jgi:hypothetical protein
MSHAPNIVTNGKGEEPYRSVFLTIGKLLKGLRAQYLFNVGAGGNLDIADGGAYFGDTRYIHLASYTNFPRRCNFDCSQTVPILISGTRCCWAFQSPTF